MCGEEQACRVVVPSGAGEGADLAHRRNRRPSWNGNSEGEFHHELEGKLQMTRGMPSMTALLGLLAIAGYQNRDKLAELLRGARGGPSDTANNQPLGGLLGNLGPMLGGAGVGGLLSRGVSELLESFTANGKGEVAQSWVDQGPNKDISTPELKHAIGSDVLQKLEQQTGLSEQEILARLSRELPSAVDKYTPKGRLPAA